MRKATSEDYYACDELLVTEHKDCIAQCWLPFFRRREALPFAYNPQDAPVDGVKELLVHIAHTIVYNNEYQRKLGADCESNKDLVDEC